jgi:DNA primase large subunit
MGHKPSYEDGHLVVAAVRVLSHNADQPPTPETVAELLGLAPDFTRNLIVALGEQGILSVVEMPFEIRVEVKDHLKVEELPRESEGPSIQDELEEFAKRKKKEVEDTEKMFTMDEIEKRKKAKLSKLDKEMKKMKGKGRSPFD